jgi:putative ABC transport system permease protein
VRSLPGVKSAVVVSDLFLSSTPNSGSFTLEDRPPFPPSEDIEATSDAVSPGFFETMQVRLVHGRFFDDRDRDGSIPVAVVNETFANKYWPNQDPTGKRFVNGRPRPDSRWITIVGVAGDMRRRGLHQGSRLEVFYPMGQRPARNMQLLVAADTAPLALAAGVRAEVRVLDAAAPVTDISTVEAEIGESLAVRRFQAMLLSLFSILAVLLAAVGIFGLMGQLVVRRTPEIGLRMALGATQGDVLKMVLRQGILLALVGAAAGALGALVLSRVLKSLLFGVSAADPVSYAGAAGVMALAVLLACGLPAWRAARVDPMEALRNDG